MWNGKDIVELAGHYNDMRKPEGFDTKQIFVSPSIRYAGDAAYAPDARYDLMQLCKYTNIMWLKHLNPVS